MSHGQNEMIKVIVHIENYFYGYLSGRIIVSKRILTNRSITIMVLITFIIIFLFGIIQLAIASEDMRNYDGATWNSWSNQDKIKFLSGYILGQVFVHEYLEDNYPLVARDINNYILYEVYINEYIKLVDTYYSYPRQLNHSIYLVLSYIYYSPENKGGI